MLMMTYWVMWQISSRRLGVIDRWSSELVRAGPWRSSSWRARAVFHGRDFVIPDDVKDVAARHWFIG